MFVFFIVKRCENIYGIFCFVIVWVILINFEWLCNIRSKEMVDSLYENEIDFGDFINDCDNICEVILLFLEFEFFVVIFNNVFECYLFDRDIEC